MNAIARCIRTQVFHLEPEELREWRLSQPGTFKKRNGQKATGWTQQRSADWMGVGWRTWQSWELGERVVPDYAVKRLVEYSRSLDDYLDRIIA